MPSGLGQAMVAIRKRNAWSQSHTANGIELGTDIVMMTLQKITRGVRVNFAAATKQEIAC